MRRTTRHVVIAAAGLAAVLTLSACGGEQDTPSGSMSGMGHGGSATTASTAAGARDGDVAFAQMMIPHHQQAVEMAEVALQNPTASPAVKDLARQIKAAQGPEIATMSGWLKAWGAPTSAAMDHGGGGMMSEHQMRTLGATSGAAFDRMWLTMMVEHHRGAVSMAQEVLSTTADPEVGQLARAVVDGQQKEIATMQALLS